MIINFNGRLVGSGTHRYKSFREFGVTDKAEEVQALHGWKAKEIHQRKARKKKTVATGPAAEFGTGQER